MQCMRGLQCNGDLAHHIFLALLFFPLRKVLGKGEAALHPLKESLFRQKQDIAKKLVFTAWLQRFIYGETKETTFERLHVDQIIESEAVLLYFKNNKTWQVMGTHHDLIALGIN